MQCIIDYVSVVIYLKSIRNHLMSVCSVHTSAKRYNIFIYLAYCVLRSVNAEYGTVRDVTCFWRSESGTLVILPFA